MSNNELIDRYLNAVKLWLPRKQQKDILAELAEDLHSQTDERESALGRPLTEDEMVALLKQRGSPVRVASGFIPEQRLINPAMLPIYRMVLRIVLLWVLAPLFALMFLGAIFKSENPGLALARFAGAAWQGLFFTIGIVTTIFWVIDRYEAQWVDRWDPRKLPRVPRSPQQMQWYNDFAGFAFGIGGCIFWGVMMWHRSAFVFDTGLRIGLAPIWGELYWPIFALALIRALTDLYCFVRPTWSAARSWVRLALDAVPVIGALLLLRVGAWVDISGPNLSPADAAKVLAWLNYSIEATLISIPLITLFDVYRQGQLLWRRKNGQSAPILMVS